MNKLKYLLIALVFSCLVCPIQAQQPAPGPSPRDHANLRRVLAEAIAAVDGIWNADDQMRGLVELAEVYWRMGDHLTARSMIQRVRGMVAPLSNTSESSQSTSENTVRSRQPGGRDPNDALAVLATNVAQFGDTEDALDILKRIENSPYADGAREMISIRQAQAGDTQAALQTALQFANADGRDLLLTQVVSVQLEHGSIADAIETAARIRPSPEKVRTLVGISHAQSVARDPRAAARSVQEALAVALQLPDSIAHDRRNYSVSYGCSPNLERSPRDQALEFVAGGQWDLGDISAATATRENIQSAAVREDVLVDFVRSDADARNFSGARQHVERISLAPCRDRALTELATRQFAIADAKGAMRSVAGISEPYARSEALFSLALTATNRKDVATAEVLFSRLRESLSEVTNEASRSGTLWFMAHSERKLELGEAAASDATEALRLVRQVEARGLNRNTGFGYPSPDTMEPYNLAEAGDIAGAQALAMRLESRDRLDAIKVVADVQILSGDQRGAEAWAMSLDSPSDRAAILLSLLRHLISQSATIPNSEARPH